EIYSDWWFASTGIPLLAATLGPLANVSSIAALVTTWRAQVYVDGQFVSEFDGVPFTDPRWCYWLNVGSLICGFVGNLFLLFNFTQRIRYIIALPATIFFWYVASGILIGITASMHVYAPPIRPDQTYTQGFWYAIAAAACYLFCSMILMVNMLGYFLGHYPDSFALTDSQRTLILQTMVFFIWLAGGAAVFSKIENGDGSGDWQFVDAMYFCDVTITTVGFGDLYPTTDLGRGLVFPYSIGGTITLALIVSSIYKSMREMGEENIKPRILLLREEKDRFQAMREIQHRSRKFRKWMALVVSVTAFGILWCMGAIVFWQTEKTTQNMTYFQALYFCYVSLLTIGYGDLAPKSNAGRTFFVIWSLIAVPTMTVLVSDMGDTVVAKFKKLSDTFADFTVLPKHGIWRDFLEKYPWLLTWLLGIQARSAMKKRLKQGFDTADPDSPTVTQDPADVPTRISLSRRLALGIKRVAADLHFTKPKRYEYEEWVEFTRLIRYTHNSSAGDVLNKEDEEGLVEWDWIGTDSPMMSGLSEPEWLLNRLCESLVRLEKRKEGLSRVDTRDGDGKEIGRLDDTDAKWQNREQALASGAKETVERETQ
ncbi:voltage-gated potassium channel, partial [Massarina eburnea CBS 473.64]